MVQIIETRRRSGISYSCQTEIQSILHIGTW